MRELGDVIQVHAEHPQVTVGPAPRQEGNETQLSTVLLRQILRNTSSRTPSPGQPRSPGRPPVPGATPVPFQGFASHNRCMTEREVLLTQIDQAFNRRSWHGTNLRGSVRGLTALEAAWRPRPDRHNIQEIVVHAAYWKYVVTRRLTGEKRGSFPLKGSNWFPRQGSDTAAWRTDLRLLEDCHGRLRATIATLEPESLRRKVGGSETALSLVSGIIAHDLYHAGQIQLLKRLIKNDRSERRG
jgi:uncharacterized damage-inducible protein DinB